MPNIDRFLAGACMTVLGISLEVLGHFQALDFLQSHWNQGYQFLNSGTTHLVVMLIGIGMLASAIRNQRKNPPPPDEANKPVPVPPPIPPPMTQKQEMSNVGNPTINLNWPPPEPPKPQRVAVEKIDLAKPNLKFVNERMAKMNVKTDGRHVPAMLHFYEIPGSQGDAALATFRNQPKEGLTVSKAENIKAHIIFTTRGGDEIGTGIASAPWLGEYHNTVDISQGESKTVLIGVCGNGKILAFNNRRSIFGANWGDDIPDDGIEEVVCEASPVIAELQLLSYSGDVLLSLKFEIDTEKRAIRRLM